MDLFGTLFGHEVLTPILGRTWTTSVEFSQIWGLKWAPESGPRTHVLDSFSALGPKEGQEGSTGTPGHALSLNSERFYMISA